MYKVPADRGFQILSSVFPNLIFINGPSFARVEEFADRFKSIGFNVLKLNNIYQRLAIRFKPKNTREESETYISDHFALIDDEAEFGEFPKEIASDLVTELHKYFDRFRTMPCIIFGNIGSMNLLYQIFDDNHAIFTYVYIYPNNAKELQRRVMDSITSASEITKKEYLSEFETLTYEYQAWKKAPKEAKGNAQKTFQGSFKKYVKALLIKRKNVFESHSEELERIFVILD